MQLIVIYARLLSYKCLNKYSQHLPIQTFSSMALVDRRTSRMLLSDANLPASGRAPPSIAGRRAPKRNYRELAGDDSDDDGGDPSPPKRIRRGLAGAGWEEADSSSQNRKERGLADGNGWEDGDSWGWSIRKKPRSARKKVGRASVSDEEERRRRAKKKGQIPGWKRRRRRPRRYESDSSYSPRAVSLRSLVTYSDGEDGGSSPTNVKRGRQVRAKNGGGASTSCHQCGILGREVVSCNKCKNMQYCVQCIERW